MRTVSIIASTVFFAAPALAQEETAEAIGAGVGLLIGLLIAVVIGAVVGWLAGLIVKGSGSGFWGNVAAGIGGSLLASVALPMLGVNTSGSLLGGLVAALIGAVALILIVRLIRKAAA